MVVFREGLTALRAFMAFVDDRTVKTPTPDRGHRSRARSAAALGALVGALSPYDAWADPPQPHLRARFGWVRESGAERCPGDAEFRGLVTSFLHSELSIMAFIERRAQRWYVRVYTLRPESNTPGVREFDNATAGCETVTRAAAFTVAVILNHGRPIDPDLPPPPPPPPPPPECVVRERPPECECRCPPPPPPPPPPRPPSARAMLASVRGGVALGVVPGFTPAFALHAEGTLVGRLRWMVEFSASLAASPDGAEDYSFRLVAARVGACMDLVRVGRLAVPGCVSVAAGEVVPTVQRVPVTASGVHPWVGAGLDLGLRVWVSRAVFAELGVNAGVTALRVQYTDPLNRPGDGAVWDGAWVHGGGQVGVGLSIP